MSIPIIQENVSRHINFTKSIIKKRRVLPKPSPATNNTALSSRCKSVSLRKRNIFCTKVFHGQSAPKKKLESHFKSPIIHRKQLALNAVRYLKNFKFNSSIFSQLKDKIEVNKMMLPSLAVKEKPNTCSDSGIPEEDDGVVEKVSSLQVLQITVIILMLLFFVYILYLFMSLFTFCTTFSLHVVTLFLFFTFINTAC